MAETFNPKKYIKRQKILVQSLTNRPNADYSLVGKVITCYQDKPEWILVCNTNGWKC